MSIPIADIRSKLHVAAVCDALDGLGYRRQSPRVELRPLTSTAMLVGRARTTLWADMDREDPRPYELELRAVDACAPDDVIVAAAGGSLCSGIWGELLATAARNRGCAGALVDGAVRDTAVLRQMGFLVYARGTCALDSLHRQRVVAIDVPVEVGGVSIRPGDLILADGDGCVVIPVEIEAEAVRRAWDKAHAENQVRDALRGGLSATEAFRRFGVL